MLSKTRLVVMASGNGTNALNIIKYFENDQNIEVNSIITNKKTAKVIDKAELLGVKTTFMGRGDFYEYDNCLQYLKQNADYIILAGFLWKIPDNIIKAFEGKIINIHPSLLPKYGGKGMYGANVHKAVIDNKEKQSGITIHLVNQVYDGGKVLFQTKCNINKEDSPNDLAVKIHELEQDNFPSEIKKYILSNG